MNDLRQRLRAALPRCCVRGAAMFHVKQCPHTARGALRIYRKITGRTERRGSVLFPVIFVSAKDLTRCAHAQIRNFVPRDAFRAKKMSCIFLLKQETRAGRADDAALRSRSIY
jgi:hypothetical protein